MTTLHRPAVLSLLAASLLFASHLNATEVSMAGGSVSFDAPANWMAIMQTEGDPEVRVFQVPDSSPTGKTSLARVTITVKQAGDISSFQQYVSESTAQAMKLTGYQADASPPEPNSNHYVAQENGVQFNYAEHYWFKNGHAVQLRCVRPSQTLAGAAWTADFDKGCSAVAERLK